MTQIELAEIQEYLEAQLSDLQGYTFEMKNDVCADANEYASSVADSLLNATMHARTSTAIIEIESALKRISYAGYGTCEECGEEIGVNRLEARPTATLCLQCQAEIERDYQISMPGGTGMAVGM